MTDLSSDAHEHERHAQEAALRRMRRARLLRADLAEIAHEAVQETVATVDPAAVDILETTRRAVQGVVGAAATAGHDSPADIRRVMAGATVGAVLGHRSDETPRQEIARVAVEAALASARDLGLAGADLEGAAVQVADEAVAVTARIGANATLMSGAVTAAVVESLARGDSQVVAVAGQLGRRLVSTLYDHDALVEAVSSAIESGFDAAVETSVDPGSLLRALAEGAMNAGYAVSPSVGERVWQGVERGLRHPVRLLGEPFVRELSLFSERLADEATRGPWLRTASWRASAVQRALKTLFDLGGVDMAASLAYFTLISFFPLMALAILLFVSLPDPVLTRDGIMEVMLFYFPASEDFFIVALDYLFNASAFLGVSSLVVLLVGSRLLFAAVNRSVNRIFEAEQRSIARNIALELGMMLLLTLLFLVSLALSPVVQILSNVSDDLSEMERALSSLVVFGATLASLFVPPLLTGVIFLAVFRIMPTRTVAWRDAAFGAAVSMIALEVSKQGFFYMGNVVSQRSLVYGPLTSVVALLSWAFVAGLVFLYGAALTKESGVLRPRR